MIFDDFQWFSMAFDDVFDVSLMLFDVVLMILVIFNGF